MLCLFSPSVKRKLFICLFMKTNTMKSYCTELGIVVSIFNPLQVLFSISFKTNNNFDILMYYVFFLPTLPSLIFSTYRVDSFRFIVLSNFFQNVLLASLEYLWPLFFSHCVSSCILEILPYLGCFIQYIT